MPRIKRAIAACAAVAATTAAFAAPANAQFDVDIAYNPCLDDPSLPTCVNYAFDVAQRTIEVTRDTYNNDVQPVLNEPACKAYELLTGRPCPGDMVPTLP
jgi:hypothetical protein